MVFVNSGPTGMGFFASAQSVQGDYALMLSAMLVQAELIKESQPPLPRLNPAGQAISNVNCQGVFRFPPKWRDVWFVHGADHGCSWMPSFGCGFWRGFLLLGCGINVDSINMMLYYS